MPEVLNKRTDIIPPEAIYVGRPSKWGNPYGVQQFGSRGKAIAMYRKWITEQVESGLLDPEELRGKDLVCWCAPQACHADVLLELANGESG